MALEVNRANSRENSIVKSRHVYPIKLSWEKLDCGDRDGWLEVREMTVEIVTELIRKT